MVYFHICNTERGIQNYSFQKCKFMYIILPGAVKLTYVTVTLVVIYCYQHYYYMHKLFTEISIGNTIRSEIKKESQMICGVQN